MNKSNLFSLFITVIVVVVAAEFLVNDYGAEPTDSQASVATETPKSSDWAEGQTKPMAIDFAADNLADNSAASDDVSDPAKVISLSNQTNEPEAAINFGLIGLSGFQNVTLKRVPFNGILFEKIDLRDYSSVPVIQQNLLQNNKQIIAGFHEFRAENELLAGEVYHLIKEKADGAIDVSINETNGYGDNSFFINYGDHKSTAFLVVKIRETVYALTYRKELHGFIEQLITYLKT
ncbi:hypothetical protein KJ951_02835 [Patescibacteria group bacterium]|nr:hypothetical protein [Patescibacteria group bacterium]MBU1703316.1 hypothetical protein [Patescibacteria group bacterium]MBU1954389.1 hypothetical protein [Patescibacteria group bacterium]